MIAAPPPPSPAAVVRRWSAALNANDNASAARLFAPNARVLQGPLDVRLTTPRLAVAFNASLPCAGTIVRITTKGNRATATFVLGHRPKHVCRAKPGERAAALFVVRDGKIVLWEEVPVPTGLPA
jgi:limonene-1,2-epoxide hydrolase